MEHGELPLKPGTLWPTLIARSVLARERNAILTISTTPEAIEQDGVAFHVRVITALARKQLGAGTKMTGNPFLPYDPDLFVADLSSTHVALLNKFNVVDHHLLIVTRSFEAQEAPLTQSDYEALLMCLSEIDGLAFYNSGQAAGASQRHKHLQMIPFPSLAEPRLPIEPLLRNVTMSGATGTIAGLPFLHAYAPVDPAWLAREKGGALSFFACYRSLLRKVGLPDAVSPGAMATSPPYNLLVTRRWMLLVPRSQECFEGISVNALGFAGALLVKNMGELATLRERGPMTALQHVAMPRKS